MTVTDEQNIIVLNGTKLILYRDNKKSAEMSLQFPGKVISAVGNEVSFSVKILFRNQYSDFQNEMQQNFDCVLSLANFEVIS